jgi:hypothetical protein
MCAFFRKFPLVLFLGLIFCKAYAQTSETTNNAGEKMRQLASQIGTVCKAEKPQKCDPRWKQFYNLASLTTSGKTRISGIQSIS